MYIMYIIYVHQMPKFETNFFIYFLTVSLILLLAEYYTHLLKSIYSIFLKLIPNYHPPTSPTLLFSTLL